MKFPWSQAADPLGLPPGNYEVEIVACNEKQSKSSGTPMWELTLKSTAFNTKLCHDRMMLAGGGVNISAAKLSALGFKKEDEVEAGHLLGKRTWVTVKETPAQGEYQRRLDVDIAAKGSNAGYWKERPAELKEPVSDEAPW